ncbi:MAG: hypothetical protein KGQ59_02335 [Bdellovibrionales bacterium]|nr:hypothetical protein [Bdellovibrionales bacterium]
MPCILSRCRWPLAALLLFLAGVQQALALPPIEARSFEAKLVRRSTSGKVFLMRSAGQVPEQDQLVLIKNDGGPLVALKVRKIYKDSEFAGQVVRSYGPDESLVNGESYLALIKIRDLDLQASDTEDDAAATAEPPENLDQERGSAFLTSEEELELQSLVIEEVTNFEQELSLIAFRVGLVILPGYESGIISPAASGIRFSQTLMHPIKFNSSRFQDSAGVDFSLMFTKLSGYTPSDNGDSFALAPVTLAGRYGVFLNPLMSVYGYAGLMKTFVISSSGDEPAYSEALALLSSFSIAIGVGASIEIGPQWVLQFEAGTNQLGINMGLKF